MIALALALLLATAPPPPKKIYRANELGDLEAIMAVLKKHVAYVKIEAIDKESGPLEPEQRDGFGVPLDDRKIAILAHLVTGAQKITVQGANGREAEAKLVLYDLERRVAILQSARSLRDLGLTAPELAPKPTRKLDDEVFALTTTGDDAAVLHGVFVYVGDEEEYGGHSRIDLKLERGMPVFDRTARFVGYSRNVAWDKDRQMLITPEMITDARTATGASTANPRANPGANDSRRSQDAIDSRRSQDGTKKPWWSK